MLSASGLCSAGFMKRWREAQGTTCCPERPAASGQVDEPEEVDANGLGNTSPTHLTECHSRASSRKRRQREFYSEGEMDQPPIMSGQNRSNSWQRRPWLAEVKNGKRLVLCEESLMLHPALPCPTGLLAQGRRCCTLPRKAPCQRHAAAPLVLSVLRKWQRHFAAELCGLPSVALLFRIHSWILYPASLARHAPIACHLSFAFPADSAFFIPVLVRGGLTCLPSPVLLTHPCLPRLHLLWLLICSCVRPPWLAFPLHQHAEPCSIVAAVARATRSHRPRRGRAPS